METPPLAGPEGVEVELVEVEVEVEVEVLEVVEVVEVDLDAMAADLDAVDQALLGLDAGTYGTCEICEVALPDELLAEDPVGRRCPEHRAG